MNKKEYIDLFEELNRQVMAVSVDNHFLADKKRVLVIASNEENVMKKYCDFRRKSGSQASMIYVAQPKMQMILPDFCMPQDVIVPWEGKYSEKIIDILPMGEVDAVVFFNIQSIDTRDVNILQIAAKLREQNNIETYGIDRDFDLFRYMDPVKVLKIYEKYEEACKEIDGYWGEV
ncbi:MAG: hypothetical protein IJ429_00530 [Lachnospiraceae bacterium]|nr:hypothetical protein [Lachnospiraceae bacterium]